MTQSGARNRDCWPPLDGLITRLSPFAMNRRRREGQSSAPVFFNCPLPVWLLWVVTGRPVNFSLSGHFAGSASSARERKRRKPPPPVVVISAKENKQLGVERTGRNSFEPKEIPEKQEELVFYTAVLWGGIQISRRPVEKWPISDGILLSLSLGFFHSFIQQPYTIDFSTINNNLFSLKEHIWKNSLQIQ